jgi:hypothetical protein
MLSGGEERNLNNVDDRPILSHPAAIQKYGCAGPKQIYTVNGMTEDIAVVHSDGSGGSAGGSALTKVMMSGDKVNIVWLASSGGKAQVIQKYSVQQDSPDF